LAAMKLIGGKAPVIKEFLIVWVEGRQFVRSRLVGELVSWWVS
jgi:hypothetical protein